MGVRGWSLQSWFLGLFRREHGNQGQISHCLFLSRVASVASRLLFGADRIPTATRTWQQAVIRLRWFFDSNPMNSLRRVQLCITTDSYIGVTSSTFCFSELEPEAQAGLVGFMRVPFLPMAYYVTFEVGGVVPVRAQAQQLLAGLRQTLH